MLDEAEWRWLEQSASGDRDHLLLGTSLPCLMEAGMHELEAWDEAVAEGAWGRAAAGPAEKLRQALDLEHWAAFQSSFQRLARHVTEVARGRHGAPPETIVALSGDVHHAYLMQVEALGDGGFVASFRRRARRFAIRWTRASARDHPPGRLAPGRGADAPARPRGGRAARRAWRWRQVGGGPWFDNQIVTMRFEGRRATMRLERTSPDTPGLECVLDHDLAQRGAS